jgi:adenosylhomocysteinase
MPRASLPPHEVADLSLASAGQERIAWAGERMPVLAKIRERFDSERPLEGIRIAACLHVTAETANLLMALCDAGAVPALCSANPLSVQDDVAAALVQDHGVEVRGWRGEPLSTYADHVRATLESGPQLTVDDGADLLVTAHQAGGDLLDGLIGGTEETTTGLVRLRRLEHDGELRCPVLAVNEARTERALNDRHGTGQSALDGIVRAADVLLAGHTIVVVGYGWAGQGVAERARGAGSHVVICEIDPLRALEARMAGFAVMPSLAAAEQGDVFITVTGVPDVLRAEHFARMKDGAVLANAGHFDVEISKPDLESLTVERREVRPLVVQHVLEDGRRIHLLADGRVVNLAAGEGHPGAVMDVDFANEALCVEHLVREGERLEPRVHGVPEAIDREVARLTLESRGVEIDALTDEQRRYLHSWEQGT